MWPTFARGGLKSRLLIDLSRLCVIFLVFILGESVATSAEKDSPFQFKDDGGDLAVYLDGKHVLSYNYAVDMPPNGVARHYRRSGYIHPLKSPSGVAVTEGFPADHMHQHAVFFAWVNSTFNERKVDFWNQHKKKGTVEHIKVTNKTCKPDYAEFTAKLKHLDLTNPEKPVAALNETWTVRIWNVEGRHQVDLESMQACATDKPLKINKYHYGGMGIRGAESWSKPGRHFVTSEGHDRIQGNHTHPQWVAMHGDDNGKEASIIAMSHPENFRHPQAVRLHPKMPYFCFAPCVDGDFTIEPGKKYRSKYRLIVIDGKPDANAINAWAEEYQKNPKANTNH